MARRALISTRWSWLAAALAAGLIWAVPVQAQRAETGLTSSPALGPSAAHGDFAQRVAIPGGRKLYLACRGTGSPTVVLEAGTSFGGMVARLYATTYPRRSAGLVSIDAQNEAFADAYKALLTPEVYVASVLNPGPLPGLESYSAVERLDVPVSAAQMRQAQADTPLRQMPLVVLSHSRDLPNPFGFPPDWPIEALERAFQDSQDELAELVPGARHVIATTSGHCIQLDQPSLVTREIRRVVRAARGR